MSAGNGRRVVKPAAGAPGVVQFRAKGAQAAGATSL